MSMLNEVVPGKGKRLIDHTDKWINILGRLKPGISREGATAPTQPLWHALRAEELNALGHRSPHFIADFLTDSRLHVLPGARGFSYQRDGYQTPLLAVRAMALLVLCIASVNVASLLLVRSAGRGREVALRSALGATRGRLVRQSLTESLVLSLAGAVAGLAMAEGTLLLMQHRLTAEFGSTFHGAIGRKLTLHPDLRVLAALLLLTLLSAFVLGLIPPFLASGKALDGALRQDGVQAGRGQSQHRLQKVLIVSELALTLALLFGCSLLLRSVLTLRRVPLGFQPDPVHVISPNLPEHKYAQVDPT